MKRVSGTLEIYWTVELPDELQHTKNVSDDPAKEAVIGFLPQSGGVYLWGKDKEYADVFIEVHEDDIVIEDDERDPRETPK